LLLADETVEAMARYIFDSEIYNKRAVSSRYMSFKF